MWGDASLCSADDRPYSPQRRVPPLPSFIQSGGPPTLTELARPWPAARLDSPEGVVLPFQW